MLHGVFGGVERRGQIVKSVFDFNLQMRIREHCLDEIALNVWGTREPKVIPAAMLPVPVVAGFVGAGVVDLILSELQLFANVGIERGGERAGDRSVLRIV